MGQNLHVLCNCLRLDSYETETPCRKGRVFSIRPINESGDDVFTADAFDDESSGVDDREDGPFTAAGRLSKSVVLPACCDFKFFKYRPRKLTIIFVSRFGMENFNSFSFVCGTGNPSLLNDANIFSMSSMLSSSRTECLIPLVGVGCNGIGDGGAGDNAGNFSFSSSFSIPAVALVFDLSFSPKKKSIILPLPHIFAIRPAFFVSESSSL